jgi:parallel beta-helix repeat protein
MAPKTSAAARVALLILACLGFGGLVTGYRPAAAQTNTPVSACQRIDAPGHYVLTTDLDGAPLNVSTPAQLLPPYTAERVLEHTCIEITGSENIGVANNVAFYNRMRGITFEGCGDCVVSQNESYSHGVLGFAIYASMNMTLEQNTAHDNRYHGFAILHDAGSATFTGNESYGNDGAGFFLEGTQDDHLTNNASRDNGLDGIALLENTQPVTIEDNTLRDNAGYGAFSLEPIDNAAFANNTFSGNALGDVGINPAEGIDRCWYTGFGPDGPCAPVFTGGPNLKDTGAAPNLEPASAVPANSGTAAIQGVRVVTRQMAAR